MNSSERWWVFQVIVITRDVDATLQFCQTPSSVKRWVAETKRVKLKMEKSIWESGRQLQSSGCIQLTWLDWVRHRGPKIDVNGAEGWGTQAEVSSCSENPPKPELFREFKVLPSLCCPYCFDFTGAKKGGVCAKGQEINFRGTEERKEWQRNFNFFYKNKISVFTSSNTILILIDLTKWGWRCWNFVET